MPTQSFARRANPLRNFQFRLKLDPPGSGASASVPGGYVAGVRTLSGLSMSVAPFEVWEGGNNLHRYANPNKVTWDPIGLEQGLAVDDTLEKWALAVVEFARTGTKPSEPVKRNVIVDVWDFYASATGPSAEAQSARSFLIHNAWISKYHAAPKLDALSAEVALLSVELVHEGWEPYAPPA